MGKEKKCTLYKKYTSYKKCIPYLILAGFTFFSAGGLWEDMESLEQSRLAQSA